MTDDDFEVAADEVSTMRCVACGHEQEHQGSNGVKHCGEWMAPVDRPRPS